jgi:hypothetical protein
MPSSTIRSAVDATVTARICTKTGLALTSGTGSPFRIARQSYGPLAPKAREPGDDVRGWSRYDTVGRTLYASADKLTAYMELLAPFRTEVTPLCLLPVDSSPAATTILQRSAPTAAAIPGR